MKKFSDISNYNFNPKSKINDKDDKSKEFVQKFRFIIDKMINDSLFIQTYGGADMNILYNSRIEGKELFIDSLLELLSDKKVTSLIPIHENIDMDALIHEAQTITATNKHKERIKTILSKSDNGKDVEEAKRLAQQMSDRMSNGEKAYYRGICAEQMCGDEGTKALREIANIFLFRASQLGYKKLI